MRLLVVGLAKPNHIQRPVVVWVVSHRPGAGAVWDGARWPLEHTAIANSISQGRLCALPVWVLLSPLCSRGGTMG